MHVQGQREVNQHRLSSGKCSQIGAESGTKDPIVLRGLVWIWYVEQQGLVVDE